MNIEANRAKHIIESFSGKKILVIGDIMIDEYLSGNVSRLSPEAPVPVVEIEEETLRFGGAANVALNIKTLGCEPLLIGLAGQDRMGDELINLLNENDMSNTGIIKSHFRPTTVKTRIIGDNQHIARVDKEVIRASNAEEQEMIKSQIDKLIQLADGMILEDYNKGVLTSEIIEFAIEKGKQKNIPVSVDPKFTNFMHYRNVTIFKPNIKEAEQALAQHLRTDEEIVDAGFMLFKTLNSESVLLTRGAKGMSLFEKNNSVTHIPTIARKVADVSGAGDTVISTMTAACVGGADKKEAAVLANIAAGIVVEEVGIVPIEKNKLLSEIEN